VDGSAWRACAERAREAFGNRFVTSDGSLCDVVDGPAGDDSTLRPNQLIAAAVSGDLLSQAQIEGVVGAVGPLITPLGPRSLTPTHPDYRPSHRGDSASRDSAYHQGTVWPWLIGAYVEACHRAGRAVDGVLAGLEHHLADFGLGSVSETADGAAPHAATGCPFQAWSVAELIRARRLAGLSSAASEPSRRTDRSNR
jgi:glycogen debranching enzyme